MKLIEQFTDTDYGATSYFYEYPNKARVVITVKEGIKDFAVDAILKAGAYFEKDLEVKYGTAHFLEHLLTNPNRVLKTRQEQDNYRFGNSLRPEIFWNASTSFKVMYFYSWGHPKGAARMLDYIKYELDFPIERFKEFLEKERGIIKAELERNYKTIEEDPTYNFYLFTLKGVQEELARRVIGDKESISSIDVDDLYKFYKSLFSSDNLVIAIQAGKYPSKALLNKIEKLAYSLPENKKGTNLAISEGKPDPNFKYKHFKKKGEQGVFASFSFPYKRPEQIDYKLGVINYFTASLISHLGFKHLRENHGLVYSLDTFNEFLSWNYKIKGFKLSFGIEKFQEVFEKLYDLLYKDINVFLESEEGGKWFQSQISKYIFNRTVNYDGDYATNLGINWTIDKKIDLYDYNISIEEAKKLTIPKLKKYVNDFLTGSPYVWIVSDLDDSIISEEFEKTKLYKKFSKS